MDDFSEGIRKTIEEMFQVRIITSVGRLLQDFYYLGHGTNTATLNKDL